MLSSAPPPSFLIFRPLMNKGTYCCLHRFGVVLFFDAPPDCGTRVCVRYPQKITCVRNLGRGGRGGEEKKGDGREREDEEEEEEWGKKAGDKGEGRESPRCFSNQEASSSSLGDLFCLSSPSCPNFQPPPHPSAPFHSSSRPLLLSVGSPVNTAI